MSAVSTPGVPPLPTTLLGLAQWCQTFIGTNNTNTLPILYAYLNQAQKDWEMEFPDHVALQKSQQIVLTAPINGVAQDLSYDFFTTAPDFRKERLVRIVAPINYSRPMAFVDYLQFRMQVPDLALTVPGLPLWWYWAPEDPSGFHVWPCPDQAYTIQFDYVAYAPELLAPTDTPFMDREFHKALGFQALYYWFISESINKPEIANQWGAKFEIEKRKYKKDMQIRQMQLITVPYATGVNEARRTRKPIFFH